MSTASNEEVRGIGQRKGRASECLRLLAPQPPRLTGCLDRGLFDRCGRTLEFVGIVRADGDESGAAEHAVAGGEVGFLLKDVLLLGRLLGVLDLADALTLGGVGDVLGLLLSDVAGSAVGSVSACTAA